MGVRLVRYKRFGSTNGDELDYRDHDELINRDLMNQHPIYAITGLQEVLNMLEDSIEDTNDWVHRTNIRIDNLILDIDRINQQLVDIRNLIDDLNIIKSVKDTYSVDMHYDDVKKEISADVKVFTDKDDTNAIQVLADGLYVPKTMTEETSTVKWTEESLGETLAEIYASGIKFSHGGSWSNIYNASEANAWYWDNNLQSFVQPKNTVTFTGFVTQNLYDYYTHSVRLRSTDSDNDTNGVVIGFVFDENGHPNTLSIITHRQDGVANSWKLIYNYRLPGQVVVATIGNGAGGTRPGNYSSSGWNSIGNGITIRVTKHRNIVTAACSNWNSTVINEATKITIDLNNYSWGYLFQGAVRYGYCNYSQAKSFFQNIEFISENIASASKLLASVKVSEEAGNEIVIKDDGIYAPAFVISPDASNSLEKRANGYFAQGVSASPLADNALEKLADGTFYVREHSNIRTVTQTNHGFTVGDFIFYHPNDGYKLASALDDYDSNIIGMITKIIDTNSFEYQWSGFFATTMYNDLNGYVQGMPLYISDVNPGKVTQEQPNISKAVGYPVENLGLIISIERGIQYNMEASIGDFKSSANTYNVRSDGFIRVIEDVDYKQSLVERLLETLSDEFKKEYIIYDNVNKTIKFTNTELLYLNNSVPEGFYLFIKAF